MYENSLQRDLLKTEMDYRLSRVRGDLRDRRHLRSLTRRSGRAGAGRSA